MFLDLMNQMIIVEFGSFLSFLVGLFKLLFKRKKRFKYCSDFEKNLQDRVFLCAYIS